MAPHQWTTKEETAFLQARLDDYKTCMPNRRYQEFWTRLGNEWFDEFPEINRHFHKKESELTEEEQVILGKAMTARLCVSTHLLNINGLANSVELLTAN